MGKRKPGLMHSLRKVDIEEVTVRHRKKCCVCDGVPETRRIQVRAGSGRAQKVTIYCQDCGRDWLLERRAEISRALHYLKTGQGNIRK